VRRIQRYRIAVGVLALLALLVAGAIAPPAQAATSTPPQWPFGVPVPAKLSLQDLLATSDASGDLRGIPGAKTCDSARHSAISLPADDAPHPNTYMEWWWWRGLLVAADGRRLGFMLDVTSKP
jgi:hypothetical protein